MGEPTKKCPYCFARILTDATKCVECDRKIGPPDRFGMAKRPFDWMAHIVAVIAVGGFFYFLYWLFIGKG